MSIYLDFEKIVEEFDKKINNLEQKNSKDLTLTKELRKRTDMLSAISIQFFYLESWLQIMNLILN